MGCQEYAQKQLVCDSVWQYVAASVTASVTASVAANVTVCDS